MSDFEDKLRSLELRQPALEWQHEITGQCTFTEPRSTWSLWLWPSPLAWAALVTIWLGLAMANHFEKPSPAASSSPGNADLPLFAYHLDDPNTFWPLAATLPQ
jgi:hypothetical protein